MEIKETLKGLSIRQLESLLPCQSAATELLIKERIAEMHGIMDEVGEDFPDKKI